MENENTENKPVSPYMLPMAVVVAGILIAGAVLSKDRFTPIQADSSRQIPALEKSVLPETGVVLPIAWGDLGSRLVSAGVIDAVKLKSIYGEQGAFTDEYKKLLLGQNDEQLKITNENAGYLLNLFWALGLASKNEILR